MPRTHVWLLDRGGPQDEPEVQRYLQRIVRDPITSPLRGIWRWLFGWLWVRWVGRRIAPACRQLGGPVPQLAEVQEQARLLRQLLGGRYDVHAVFRHGGADAERARAALGNGDRVVLLPLHPQRHPEASRAALDDAWKVLNGAGHAATAIEAWGNESTLADLLALHLRRSLIPHAQHGTVGVVLLAPAPPEGRAAADYLDELASTATLLRQRARLTGPVVQAWVASWTGGKGPAPDLPAALTHCREKGAQVVLVVPLGWCTTWPELRLALSADPEAMAQQAKLAAVVPVPTPAPSVELARLLVPLIRNAEQEAGWPVPEDDVARLVLEHLNEAGLPTVPGAR